MRGIDGKRLAGKGQQRFVQLGQVGVEPVVSGAPAERSFVRGKIQHGEVVCCLPIAQLGKLLPDKGGGVVTHYAFAFLDRQHGAKHTLVFSVGLAKVERRHTLGSIGKFSKSLNSTMGPFLAQEMFAVSPMAGSIIYLFSTY